jgi:hypothetical protein
MRNDERNIYIYDLFVGKRSVHAQSPKMIEIMRVLDQQFNSGDCKLNRDNGNVVFRISDVNIDEQSGFAELLIRRADKNASDAAFSNLNTGKLRVERKQSDEGGDFAAQISISLEAERGKPNMYLCLVEGVTGISHRTIQPLLNRTISNACKNDQNIFKYRHPSGALKRDGSPKTSPFMPLLEFRGHISDSLVSDIENGKVSKVQLIKSKENAPLAGNRHLTEHTLALNIEVSKNMPNQGRFKQIFDAITSRKSDFDVGRIFFVDPDNRSHSVTYDLDTGTPEQQNYVKSFVVRGISPPLDQSSESLVRTFCDLVKDELLNRRSC